MKKFVFALTMALLISTLAACASTSNRRMVDAVHNSRNSVDWSGDYSGTIRFTRGTAAVWLTLREDETYEMRYKYSDRAGDFVEQGTFKWDSTGSAITLDTRSAPAYYQVGENILIQLNENGKPIAGKLSGKYVLRK